MFKNWTQLRIFINSIEGKEKYYGKFGFTTDIYSTNHVIAKPKPILNELASGNLFRKCLQSEEISIEEFSDFTDEINKFDLEIRLGYFRYPMSVL